MKKIMSVVSALFVALFVSTASAQSAPPAVRFDSATTACLRAYATGVKADIVAKCVGVDDTTQTRLAALAAEINALKAKVKTHGETLKDHEARLAALESAKPTGDGGKAAVAQLKVDIATELGQIKALQAAHATQLAARLAGETKLDDEIGGIELWSRKITERVTALEARQFVTIGARAGVIVLASLDKTLYSGGMMGPRLTLHPNKNVWVAADVAPMISGGKLPLGVHNRVGLGYNFTSQVYGTAGASGTWVGLNESVKAQAFYLMADGGVGMRFGAVELSGSLLLGSKFSAKNGAALAGGGVLQLGATF